MPLTSQRTPYDLTIHLATPGNPVSFREMVQQVYASPDGLTTEPVGEPTIQGGEYRGEHIAAIVGQAMVAAQAQAAASEQRAQAEATRAADAEQFAAQRLADAEGLREELGTAMETISQLRAGLAEAQAEIARLRAGKTDSVGPA